MILLIHYKANTKVKLQNDEQTNKTTNLTDWLHCMYFEKEIGFIVFFVTNTS